MTDLKTTIQNIPKKTDYTTQNPLNQEPNLKDLVSSFITPLPQTYNRNHGPIPHVDKTTHTLHITGLVAHPQTFSIAQLAHDFPQHEVTCALECAGNRRHAMRTLLREVEGIDWGDAAVMNCTWRGPRVRDVLGRAGVDVCESGRGRERERELSVWFSSFQVPCQGDGWFGGSIGLGRCLDEDGEVILALEMNNAPLPVNHGHPLRAVLPGISGSKWVKWLDQISIEDQESPNHYQRHDYRILPPEAVDKQTAQKYWPISSPLEDVPVNSVIAVPGGGERVFAEVPDSGKSDSGGEKRGSKLGIIEVKGYAIPHGKDGPVRRVEVSGDGGRSWVEAALEEPRDPRSMKWCWVLWGAKVLVEKGEGREVVSRAVDSGGNVQREHSQWNLRGVGYHGFGRVCGLAVV